jgi:hypothetical protein
MFDPAGFVASVPSAQVLTVVSQIGWQLYYAARARLVRLAYDALPDAQAVAVTTHIVEAAKAMAQQPINLEVLAEQLEKIGLPAVKYMLLELQEQEAKAKTDGEAGTVGGGVAGGSEPAGAVEPTGSEVVHEAGVDRPVAGGGEGEPSPGTVCGPGVESGPAGP